MRASLPNSQDFSAHDRMASVPENKRTIHLGWKKKLLGSAMMGCAGLLRARNALTSPPAANAVLVLEPFGLGDMISFEPLISEIHRRGWEARVCARKEWQVLFPKENVPAWLHPEIPWTTYDSKKKYRLSDYWAPPFRGFLQRLQQLGRGAIGLDTRGDVRSVILLYLAGCRRVISLGNYLGADLSMLPIAAQVVPGRDDFRRWQINLLFLRALGFDLPGEPRPPRFSHLIRQHGTTRRVILNPIAPWEGKWWDREKWIELTGELRKRGWEPVAYCGPKQTPSAERELGGSVPITECNSIEMWIAELQKCAFVITVDSGPMHLADGLGVPVIALFGQGKLPLWAPSGPRSAVITHQDDPDFQLCHPIDTNTPLGRKFMTRITVSEVLQAVDRFEVGA